MHDWDTPEYERRMHEEYERIRSKHPALVTTGFSCFAGWFPILERFFDEVAVALDDAPDVKFELWQVKEKFGGLCVYYVVPRSTDANQIARADEVRRKIGDAYKRARTEAKTTCDVCGQSGVLREHRGWWATRCEEHADGGLPYRPEDTDA